MISLLELGLALLGISVAYAGALLLVPQVRRLAIRRDWVDRPDAVRKRHAQPTPSMGGLAIAGGMAAGLALLLGMDVAGLVDVGWPPLVVWAGALILMGIGAYDDAHGVGFKVKFVAQIVAAYALLHAGYRLDLSGLPFMPNDVYTEALYSIPVTVLWVVGVINAINLIDGLDGLAAGVAAVAFFCLATVFSLQGDLSLMMVALVICGALAGFLAHNFNPAAIFMGDTGSLLLGYLLAVFSLSGTTHGDPILTLIVPVVALGLPVVDTTLAIVRRLHSRRAVCGPDDDHIHHRMARRFSTPVAVLILYAVAAVFGAGAIGIAMLPAPAAWSLVLLLIAATLGGIAALGYMQTDRLSDAREELAQPNTDHVVREPATHEHKPRLVRSTVRDGHLRAIDDDGEPGIARASRRRDDEIEVYKEVA